MTKADHVRALHRARPSLSVAALARACGLSARHVRTALRVRSRATARGVPKAYVPIDAAVARVLTAAAAERGCSRRALIREIVEAWAGQNRKDRAA
jgi:hypothetical protein